MKSYCTVMSIAGSDSGGGAGIQADLKAISACGCFATTALTAITAQNTLGVTDIHPIPIPTLQAQIRAILDDIGANAVKIGMLHSTEVIVAVAELLQEYDLDNIVLDPVMVATSGARLIEADAVAALQEAACPLARIITPNIPEAEILLGRSLTKTDELEAAAVELGERFSTSVLAKGGHLQATTLTDILYDHETGDLVFYENDKVDSRNTHGTGCTLSSAIAAFLAQDHGVTEAVGLAIQYIAQAIYAGAEYSIGGGHGPVHHFHAYWD